MISLSHEAIESMDYDSTNNVFSDISDCELHRNRLCVEQSLNEMIYILTGTNWCISRLTLVEQLH